MQDSPSHTKRKTDKPDQITINIDWGARSQNKTPGSFFSLLGLVLNGFFVYKIMALWVLPKPDDIEWIYNIGVLMGFEFIMVHSRQTISRNSD